MVLVKDGNGGNPLLGFPETDRQLSTEEADQMERSEKKIKRKAAEYTGDSTMPISYADIYDNGGETHGASAKQSYKQSLLGEEEELNQNNHSAYMEAEENEEDDEFEGLKVVEKKVGEYDCPEFILSEREESRIQRPWRQGLIVKLMGRRIGYKALETRLKQIWVRKGVISIIDLGYEYFLVYFTNEEDYTKALEDGPWLIYDHYLIAREWTPNFHPSNAKIEKAAVWVRISGLPIEYYDAKVLHYIGNRIGQTVKVDRNTLLQERGKYARVCVEVDLNKPLLAMFELKDEIYKVEYEGLHMLCRTCGKFGHYVEGCPEKKTPCTASVSNEERRMVVSGEGMASKDSDMERNGNGAWVVVQKPRRQRKARDESSNGGKTAGAGRSTGTGTRFQILDSINEDPEIEGVNDEEIIICDKPINNNTMHGKERGKNGKNGGEKKGKTADNKATRAATKDIPLKDSTGGTRVANNIQILKKTDKEGLTRHGNQGSYETSQQNDGPRDQQVITGPDPHATREIIPGVTNSHAGPHHMTRPPDDVPLGQHVDHNIVGPNVNSDTSQVQRIDGEDMEIVQETPNLDQPEGGVRSMVMS
ncbi:zinc ion binding / nucleic acid binding protein [Trifolium repens]|nr:zinc ion binding / nucleic acid binding protein [Trifolium repens]